MLKSKKLRSIIDYKHAFFTTIFVNLYFEERPYQIKTIEGRYSSVKCLVARAVSVIQSTGRTDFEDGSRIRNQPVFRNFLKRWFILWIKTFLNKNR